MTCSEYDLHPAILQLRRELHQVRLEEYDARRCTREEPLCTSFYGRLYYIRDQDLNSDVNNFYLSC